MKYSMLILLLAFSVTGCVRSSNNLPTFGQQLTDLIDAHQSGVISTTEYTRLRKRLMRTMLR